VHVMQSLLSAVCDLQDVVGLALLAVFQGDADPWFACVVPRRLDEQSARERRAGLRDRALPAGLARLAQRRDKPEPGAERGGALKALPVAAELEVQRERRERVDAAKAAQPGDRRPPLLFQRQA